MFLPRRLLAIELQRRHGWKYFLNYKKLMEKTVKCDQRIVFLQNCKKADIIPKFLKFRIPNNGCFDDNAVHKFQKSLLQKEISKSKDQLKVLNNQSHDKISVLRDHTPTKCIPSVLFHIRYLRNELKTKTIETHCKKLQNLSLDQGKPLFRTENTVKWVDIDNPPPAYVIETLSLGPRSAVIDEFNPKEVLAEIDNLLRHCRENGKFMMDDWITDINVKTVNYIKKCKKIKCARHLKMTKKYLKDNKLLAVPFDKGVGICLMSKDSYNKKMDKLIKLPQFKKLEKGRSNAKNPILKEEERVLNTLKDLKKKGKISENLFDKMKPVGSQPARLYGLAKIHKTDIPMRPVLSMPGSAYHGVAQVVSNWLSNVPECQINCNTKTICDALKYVNLEKDESIVSFDVTSLYTNVPVIEAIERCADLLFKAVKISVDKETFIELAKIASCNVVMSTHDGFYRQIDGLAMGSAPAPFLANGWLSQFDPKIKDDAKLYYRYMDDIVREIKTENIDQKLNEINS